MRIPNPFAFCFCFFLLPSSILLTVLSGVREAAGGEFTLTPSLWVSEEYNNNVFLAPSGGTKDFITTISPALKLQDKTERMDLDVSAGVSQLLYATNSGLNTLNQNYLGNARYQLTPELKVAGSAGYSVNETPNREILTTGITSGPSTLYRQLYFLSGDYALTERTGVTLFSRYGNDHYSGQSPSDFESFDGGASLNHDLSSLLPALKGIANLGYSRYLFSSSTVENYTATLGASLSISEVWKFLFDGGVRFTRQINPTTFEQTGFVGHLKLSREGERTTWNIGASHDLLPASAVGGTTERTSFFSDITHRFTYELRGSMFVNYFLNKSQAGQFATQTLDTATSLVGSMLRYEFNRDVALEGSYRYIWLNDKQQSTNAYQSLFLVRLVLQHKLFE